MIVTLKKFLLNIYFWPMFLLVTILGLALAPFILIGSQAFFLAMMYWTMEGTGSASLMGILMTLSMLPGVVLGPVAGNPFPQRILEYRGRLGVLAHCLAVRLHIRGKKKECSI